jgi:hypothetical protein
LLDKKVAMADDVNNSWYVTFEVPKTMKQRGRRIPRATKRFQNESDAKEFARIKYAAGRINAGTINPHLPKRVIAWTEIHRWFEEPREQETAADRPIGAAARGPLSP